MVYADDYVSAANIIEAGIQAYTGYQSRLWNVKDYEAAKCTLDSDQLVLFLGDFEENAAAKAYAKVFERTEKANGCVYSIAGSKALIHATGEAAQDPLPVNSATHFYSDSDGVTHAKASVEASQVADSSIWRSAAQLGLAGVGGWLIEKLTAQQSVSRQEQVEVGCKAFMTKRFADWVKYDCA
ncbi:hypothetical protein ACRS2Y_01260 [Pseudomonas putida]